MRQKLSKCVLSLVLVCTSLFVVGIVLLILGFLAYMSEPAPPAYIYSVNLCEDKPEIDPVTNLTLSKIWVGYQLREDQDSCPTPLEFSNDQFFNVPKGVLGESVPYDIMVYSTNKVIGEEFQLSFYENAEKSYASFETTNKPFSLYPKVDFAICGGKQIKMYRDGPPNEDDGDLISNFEDCKNTTSGCIYEPARSLSSYDLSEFKPIHLTDIPASGSKFKVSARLKIPIKDEGSNGKDFIPELYVEFKVGGRGPEQDKGLILLIIGGVLADTMPATLYFLLQKYHFKKQKNFEHDTTGIPLMEMDQ
ncbi:hypothetical protein DICPUDRAFT_75877 [Dictyostelium purpureum]|uniref:Uncharacterized protein n=1 Tax=Dictyostelium purpureum TaxID=5786 RepID=F0ZBX7_DICPU|nr:uncharacterized protein DICPUDRAFT_75877 [Dictyostelium purpureum]EGC38536.1 hypothetical protein DICPUDRAFT_75877 [Dictyostelium purpureum]|eukprot:XP_003284907.1 hypothetical protein DICPUDRAFT_75877 [Dictyostelium purpureum]